jgi:FkbM family methyltransferase
MEERIVAEQRRRARKLERRLRRVERRLGRRIERRLGRRIERRLKRMEQRLPPEPAPDIVGVLDYPRARIELRARTAQERFRLRAADKEPWTIDWIDRWIRPGECLYDVGANVGAYALIAAKGPARASVVAFEPGFATYATLCENVAHNAASGEVIPVPMALSDAAGVSTFNYRDLGSGEAMHGLGERDADGAVFQQSILTWTLDELVERFPLPRPNHLKLDVDGAEAATLRGARGLLAAPQLRTVMVEVAADEREEVAGLLGEAGLELAHRTEPRVKHGRVNDFWYELWARPEQG